MNISLNFAKSKFLRAGFGAALIAGTMAFASVSAEAASPAEAYIQTNVQQGLSILNNSSLSKDQRATQFRTFLLGLTDLKRISAYTLGPAKNTTSPADLAAFNDAFRDYAFAVYETELAKYSGQTLRVTGSVPHGANDAIVTTQLIDPNSKGEPIEVDFRVFGTPGHYMVGDITVLGMDLAITEQDQFTSFLQEHNNDVKALTADLKQRAANVRSGGSISGH